MAESSTKIRILSAGAPKLGVSRCAEAFTRRTGHAVGVEFDTAPVLRERVDKGEAAADLLVAPVALMADLAALGKVVAEKEVVIGSVTAGVAIRKGADVPDISSAETLRQALLDADAVLYNVASSGQYIAGLIERLGIAAEIASRTERLPTGAAVMKRLAEGTAPDEIAFGQIPEIRRFEGGGVSLVGPLPAEIGKKTAYAAALLADAENRDAAGALLAFMDTPDGRRICADSGLEPV